MPRVSKQPPVAEVSPEYQLTLRLLTAFQAKWNEEFKAAGVDAMMFSRMSVVALTQLSAMVAVDVGMQPRQFVAVCEAQFNSAHERAPKFS